MIDYGTMGTLHIGLEAVRREQDLLEQPRSRPRRHASREPLRHALAVTFRSLANWLEPSFPTGLDRIRATPSRVLDTQSLADC